MHVFILTSLFLASAQPAAPAPQTTVAEAPRIETVELPASKGRTLSVSVFPAASSKGVVLFGHGLGAEPKTYAPLIERWRAAGFTTVAPLSVDSKAHPRRSEFDLQSGFGARVEDLMIVRGFVASRFAGQKVVLAGHSYGSLFALIGAGAKTPAGELKGPPVSGLLLFSSPGAIPGLVSPGSFARVALPMVMVTGDKDVVPGFVPDPKAHRLAFDEAVAGNKLLVTVKGGDHFVAANPRHPAFDPVASLSTDFLASVLSGSEKAARRLTDVRSGTAFAVDRR